MVTLSVYTKPLLAGTLSFEVNAGEPVSIKTPWLSDDDVFASPPDYSPGKPTAERVLEAVTLDNIGKTPLKNWSLEINGKDMINDASMRRWLAGDQRTIWSLYDRWKSVKHHGARILNAEFSDPWGIVNLWGDSLCCMDALAFASIALPLGIRSRSIPMNQHTVNEYLVDGRWVVLDTDQNLFYPKWDGVTPASFEDLRQDPFLALRAKPFGKRTAWNPTAAWWNLSLFDFSATNPLRKAAKNIVGLKRAPYALLPGGGVTWRHTGDDLTSVIVTAMQSSDQSTESPAADPYSMVDGSLQRSPTSVSLSEQSPTMKTLCSINTIPTFRSGINTILLKCIPNEGKGRISIYYSEQASGKSPPIPPVLHGFSQAGGAVSIIVDSPRASEWWWQISQDADFLRVPPNFDRWEESSPNCISITNPVEQTFLVPERTYCARAKSCVDGLWSTWSTPLEFKISKPSSPQGVKVIVGHDSTTIHWNQENGKMLIFGSDRADFVPEVLFAQCAETGILERGGMAINFRDDRNLLVEIDADKGLAVVPPRNFYRLIRSDNNILSLPTSLIRIPVSLMKNKPLIFSRSKDAGEIGNHIAWPIYFQ